MRIKCIAAIAIIVASISGALAQTGAPKNNTVLTQEIDQLFPDNITQQIIPFNARQTLLDILASGGGGGTISGTACNSTQLNTFQQFVNTSSTPSDTYNIWDGNQCIPWALLNTTNHTFALNRTNTTNFWTNVAAGTVIHRMNDRIFIGAATPNDGNSEGNNTTKDWVENLRPFTTDIAQTATISTIGQIGALFATRTSDSSGSGSQGAQALSIFAVNDNTSVNNQSTYGAYVENHLFLNVTNGVSLGIEIDPVNRRGVTDITPTAMHPAGLIVGLWLAGGGGGQYTGLFDNSAAIGITNNSSAWRKGIVFDSTALTTSVGGGGDGVAMEMARNQSIRWLNSTPATDAEIWANAFGLNISGNIFNQSNTSSTPQLTLSNYTTDALSALLVFNKSLNFGNTVTNDTLGQIEFGGFSNSTINIAAYIRAYQTSSSSGSNIPSAIQLFTSNASGLNNQGIQFDGNAHWDVFAQATAISGSCSGFSAGSGSTDFAGGATFSSTTSCTVTFGATFANAPHCIVAPGSSPVAVQVATNGTSFTATFASAVTSMQWICPGQ